MFVFCYAMPQQPSTSFQYMNLDRYKTYSFPIDFLKQLILIGTHKTTKLNMFSFDYNLLLMKK